MGPLGRRGLAAAAFGGVAIGAVLAACGIDESGLATDGGEVDVSPLDAIPVDVISVDVISVDASDGGTNDAVSDVVPDVPLPPACSTTDVSCFGLDGGLPEGWSPYVYEADGGACPAGDFTRADYVANPRLASGCGCSSCTPQGAWACTAALTIDTGHSGCGGGTATVDAGACALAAATDDRTIGLTNAAVVATGVGVGCDAGAPSAPVAASDPVAVCAAGCEAGAGAVCGQADPAQRCIVADGVQACPGNLTRTVVGASAGATCKACTCGTSQAPVCKATAKIYFNSNTTDTTCQTLAETLQLDGTCQTTNEDIQSFSASWVDAGGPSCTPGGGGGADAGLSGQKTICCTK